MARLYFQRHNNDGEAKKEFLYGIIPIKTDDCYSYYPYVYNGDENDSQIYFGFYANSDILKLIEEINGQFKNIKVVVVFFGELACVTEFGFYGFNLTRSVATTDRYTYCLFRIELSKEYSYKSNYALNLILAQFLRGYCPEYSHYRHTSMIKDNFIDNMLVYQNTGTYGAWMCCGFKRMCSRDTFNKLDSIELVNNVSEEIVTDMEEMPGVHEFINCLETTETKESANET